MNWAGITYVIYRYHNQPQKKKTVSKKPTPMLKSSDALKLFGFLYVYEGLTYFMTHNTIIVQKAIIKTKNP